MTDLRNQSISHATLLSEHVLPAFRNFIYDDPEILGRYVKHVDLETRTDITVYASFCMADEWFRFNDKQNEDVSYLINETLFDFFNDIAPTGYYFGSHPGNGSDFGFWKYEDEETELDFVSELNKQLPTKEVFTGSQMFKAIKAGRYSLSIQGSTGHYCSPRQRLNPDQYQEMELAIFSNKGWLNIKRSTVIPAFPRWDELRERMDGDGTPATVFSYVPVDLINDLYLYLKSK